MTGVLTRLFDLTGRVALVTGGSRGLGKLGGDTDLTGAAVLLASDAGGQITGQTIVVDGGASII